MGRGGEFEAMEFSRYFHNGIMGKGGVDVIGIKRKNLVILVFEIMNDRSNI